MNSTNTSPAGCLEKYASIVGLMNPEHLHKYIAKVGQIKGFLCNYQIPLLGLIAHMLNARSKVAEIGVWYGRTSSVLLSNNNIHLFAVDTFEGSEEHQDELKGKTFQDDYVNTIKKLGCEKRVSVIKGESTKIAKDFKNDNFDLIFIDAAHDYENVKNDILAWTPKLKSGGLMILHDWPGDNNPDGGFGDLKRAVDDHLRYNEKFQDFGGVWGICAAQKI